MSELLEIERARELVLERVRPLPGEMVALERALGRVLAADVHSERSIPAFDNSSMDGLAVRADDTSGASGASPRRLALVGESRAGHHAVAALGAGEAVRISTGAALPAGADAVIRVEDVELRGGSAAALAEVQAGENVRRAGEDLLPGELAIPAGVSLGPAEVGVLGSLGLDGVSCAREPAVAVLSTGDELLERGEPHRPGAVWDSNSYSISALVERCGGQVAALRVVRDELQATHDAIAAALAHDVLVVCGGVSVGEHDHVRPALALLGIKQVFWGLALRPGKPTWFGESAAGGLVFGLPGNPVSAMVTFLLLVRPALRALLGAPPGRDRARAVLDEDYAKQPGRAHAVRCRLELGDDGWHARSTGAQGSHILTSMLGADALAIIPSAAERVRAGERVDIELIPRG
jgi:molybdopterin molybdotransferase